MVGGIKVCDEMMDYPKKSNKIRDIVRLQQIVKKWKRLANGEKSRKTGMKKCLSFTEDVVPKGYLAVCVGKELKRFVIPTHYLTHQAFQILLREAEEEFGFQQEGVLQIPCHVSLFQNILNTVQHNHNHNHQQHDLFFHNHPAPAPAPAPDNEITPTTHLHTQMCT